MKSTQEVTKHPGADWLKVSEATAYSGYSRSWIHRAADNGDLESRSQIMRGKSRGRRFISKISLDAFLSGQGKAGTSNGNG